MDEVSHDAGALRHAAVRVRIGRGLQIVSLTLTVIEVAMLVAGVPVLSLADAVSSPWVFGPFVVANPGTAALVLIALLPWVFLAASVILRYSAALDVRRAHRSRRAVEVARNLASVIAAFVMVPLVAPALLLAIVEEGYVVGPPSEAGDRIVIVERHFLLLSSGDVYIVPAGALVGEHVGAFTCDDAYSPVYAGSYRVTWHGRCAHVQVWSDSAVDPMVPLDVTASVGEGVSSRCGD